MSNVHDESHTWDERGGNFDEGSHDQTRSEAGQHQVEPMSTDVHNNILGALTGDDIRRIPQADPEPNRKRILRSENMFRAIQNHTAAPKRALFGEFWMERELAYMFATTGAGKSLYGNQIALAISEGRGFDDFRCEAGPLRVGLVDLENTLDDHKSRLGSYAEAKGYVNPNYFRIRVDPDADISEMSGNRNWFLEELKREQKENNLQALIIDNFSYLQATVADRDKQVFVGVVFQELKRIAENGCAVLVIGHTNKSRSKERSTIELADQSGSTQIQNVVERMIAIGSSVSDKYLKYAKLLKGRTDDPRFSHSSHVAALRLIRDPKEDNLVYLKREPHLDGPERNFLREEEGPSKTDQAKIYLDENPETTTQQLSEKFGIDKALASRIKSGKR